MMEENQVILNDQFSYFILSIYSNFSSGKMFLKLKFENLILHFHYLSLFT